MNVSILNGIAAGIVGRAAFCALDFGTGSIADYIPSCYDAWRNDWMRLPGAQEGREQVAHDVREQLVMIGFNF